MITVLISFLIFYFAPTVRKYIEKRLDLPVTPTDSFIESCNDMPPVSNDAPPEVLN